MVERVKYLTDEEQDGVETTLGKPFREFEQFMERYKTIPGLSDANLGVLLREYITESNHGGWDCFTLNDLLGIGAFLTDLMTYGRNME